MTYAKEEEWMKNKVEVFQHKFSLQITEIDFKV